MNPDDEIDRHVVRADVNVFKKYSNSPDNNICNYMNGGLNITNR